MMFVFFLETDVLIKRVSDFIGPSEYLFAASISRKCRQMQIVLSYKRAEGSSSRKAKLRTSFTAALTSPARLQWAFSSGLKQKDKYYKPLQLLQSAMKVSNDAVAVLGLLQNVQSLKKVDPEAGSELCATAAERGDLELLKWLHAHECPWDVETCNWLAFKGDIDSLKWARQQPEGCPWDETTCSYAAEGGQLHTLQWAREQGCPWDEWTCYNAAWKGNLRMLQWARANGCAWHRENVLRVAAMHAGVDMLEWLQGHSGKPWSDEDKAAMLLPSSPAWPTSFIGSTTGMFQQIPDVEICWTEAAMQWALANGCTWGEWQCQKLNPDLYTIENNRSNAISVFAWAHKNGCPCTCDRSSSSSESK
jgi:hypothetical protein